MSLIRTLLSVMKSLNNFIREKIMTMATLKYNLESSVALPVPVDGHVLESAPRKLERLN
jgi:hypothetical protein